MKLNLLPVTVSRGAKSRSAWIVSILIVAASAVGCFFLVSSGEAALATANDDLQKSKPDASKALAMSTEAETIIAKATPFVRNTSLAQKMIAGNRAYPDLYQDLFGYIPPFFRIYSISASPVGADTAQVVLQGTLTSYQQYADLMLALMRDDKVISVSRTGFESEDPMVPALQSTDQIGTPHGPNDPPVPSDPLERLTYFQSLPKTSGYTGVGNFGAEGTPTKFAMPGDSAITVQILLKGAIQVPNPTSTLTSGGGASSTTVPALGGATMGPGGPGGPGGPSGPSGRIPGPPAGAAPSRAGGSAKDAADKDSD